MTGPPPTSTLFPTRRSSDLDDAERSRDQRRLGESARPRPDQRRQRRPRDVDQDVEDRKSTRLNSSHEWISYAVFCLKKKIEDHADSHMHEDQCKAGAVQSHP